MNRLLVAALCGLLAGCAADGTGDAPAVGLVTRRIEVVAGALGSRTQLAPDGAGVEWTPGDRIGVFILSGDRLTARNAPLAFTGTAPAAAGTFSGEVTLDESASSYTLYAYYPYDPAQAAADPTAVAFTLPSRQRAATGDTSHLGDYAFLMAEPTGSATPDFPALGFRHVFAVVEMNLTSTGALAGSRIDAVTLYATDAASVTTDGTLTDMANLAGAFRFDLTTSSPADAETYAGGSAQVDYCALRFDEPPVLGSDPVRCYAVVNATDYARGNGRIWGVVQTSSGRTATFSRPGLPFAPGQMKVVTEDLGDGAAPGPEIDLSAEGPANCYVAHLPSQSYSFDATVAGNGAIPADLAQAVERFEGRALSAALPAGEARLLWQSNPDLLEPASVRYEGGRIRFATTGRPTVLGGNAVIGLYPDAASDEALWSWHIWITDASPSDLLAAAETYALYPAYEALYGAGNTRMMDRNLGAVYKEDGAYARSFRAPLYQWGRKDPFPWGKTIFDADNRPHNFINEYRPVQTTGSPGAYAGYTGNTWYATAHPMIFIATVDGTSYDWYWGGGKGGAADVRNNALWGNAEGWKAGENTSKTFYDPCPPGWKVPHIYVFSAFTRTGTTAPVAEANVTGRFVQGWNFLYDGTSASYYPGVGYRYDEMGLFQFWPTGYYWSSAPSESLGGSLTLGLTQERIYIGLSYPRGTGIPVRCMRE